MKQNSKLNEHLSENDLKWLVDDGVLVDMHKTKLGEDKDYIVLSIAVLDRTPADDLARFIENGIHDYKDVEVSPATDTKGRYLVYVEVERNSEAYGVISGVLDDCKKLSGITEWKFKTMGLDNFVPLDAEQFAQYVITDPVEYERQHPAETDKEQGEEDSVQESLKNRLNFLLKY